MADVHALPGVVSQKPATNQSQPEIVARLHELLKKAEAGEIQAFAYAYTNHEDRACEAWIIGHRALRIDYALGIALSCLHQRYFNEWISVGVDVKPGDPSA